MRKILKEIFYTVTMFLGILSALMGALMLQDALSGKNNVFLSLLVIISGFLAFSYQYLKEDVDKNDILKLIFWFGIAFVWFVGVLLLIVIVTALFS